MNTRPFHWFAGLFTGYLCFVNIGAAILLAALFNFWQCIDQYTTPDAGDFSQDTWEYMSGVFLGAGIGLVIFYLRRIYGS